MERSRVEGTRTNPRYEDRRLSMEGTGWQRDNRQKSDYGGRYVSVIARLSLGGAVGVNARMHIQNGAPHILMLSLTEPAGARAAASCVDVNVNGTCWHPACLYLATVGGIAVMDTYHRHN